MSVVYKGQVINSDLTKTARGGTELMRDRFLAVVSDDLKEQVAIHFSRPNKIYDDVPNILYIHDLPGDPAIVDYVTKYRDSFAKFVFVSYYQRDQFIRAYGLLPSKCVVIQNAIDLRKITTQEKPKDQIKIIYHTTPHRGLELAYHIVDAVSKRHENIQFDVFSSFSVYGWDERDKPYEALFDAIKKHPNMAYYGGVSNERVLKALSESHIFLYPSIWEETSCLAMIEALAHNCLCIYPSYGALIETGTSGSQLGMYDFTEIKGDHMNKSASILNSIIEKENQEPGFIEQYGGFNRSDQWYVYSLDYFKTRWESIIKEILNENNKRKQHSNLS